MTLSDQAEKYRGYFSPSAAARWLTCTASAEINARAERTDTAYSLEGTMAHELATLVFDGTYKEAALAVGKRIKYGWDKEHEGTVTAEMADYVQDYVDYCRELALECDETAHEMMMAVTFAAGGRALADWIGVSDDTLHVVDFKYGAGVKVYAQGNEQGLMYAGAAMEHYRTLWSFSKVAIHIHQPRLEHVDRWDTTVEEVDAFVRRVKKVVLDIACGDVEYKPSEKACRFCAIKGTCAAYADKATLAARDVFEGVEEGEWPPKGAEMTPQDRSTALHAIPLLRDWIKATEEAALSDIEQGIEIPGWKVVEGRSLRQWDDPEAVLELLKSKRSVKREDYTREQLLTVAQLEKVLKSKPKVLQEVAQHITKPLGKHTLVPESDKRPAIGRPEDAFAGIATSDDPLEN